MVEKKQPKIKKKTGKEYSKRENDVLFGTQKVSNNFDKNIKYFPLKNSKIASPFESVNFEKLVIEY